MEAERLDPFEGLDDESRERLLIGLASDGPDLAKLLIELAGLASAQGKTRLAANLYNSALYQEEARGRPGSEIAVACTRAIAEIELKVGDPATARIWARRLQLIAPDDRTSKTAARLGERAAKAITAGRLAARAAAPTPPTTATDPRVRKSRLPVEVVPSKGPSTDAPSVIEGLVQSILGGGPELGGLLLEAAQRAFDEDDKTAALRLTAMTLTAERGRGEPASATALNSMRLGARIHLERNELFPAERLASELAEAPDRAANREGERLRKLIERKKKANPQGPADLAGGHYAPFTPEPLQPDLTFSDVGGMSSAKEAIRRFGILPAQDPKLAARFGIEPGGAILLSGPPGCGKTMLAEAAAGEMGVPFYVVRASDIVHPLFGMSERNLANCFKTARAGAPCVLFFDEIDALCHKRSDPMSLAAYRDNTNVLLAEMDGIAKNLGVLIMGATNVPELIDPALLRPGRFSRQIFVGKPDEPARESIWRVHLEKRPTSDDVDLATLVELSDGLTGAEIAGAVRDTTEAVWVQCAEDGEERSIGMIDILTGLRPYVEGPARSRIDELVRLRWQEAIG